MPVTVTSDQPIETAPARASELIEIELAGGYRLRVGGGVKAPALRFGSGWRSAGPTCAAA